MQKVESESLIEVTRILKVIQTMGLAEDCLSSKRLSHRSRRSTFVYKAHA
jgi:hypothetical protein